MRFARSEGSWWRCAVSTRAVPATPAAAVTAPAHPHPGRIPARSAARPRPRTVRSKHTSRRLRRFLRVDEAISALEYAILVAVVAAATAAMLGPFFADVEEFVRTLPLPGTHPDGSDPVVPGSDHASPI